MPASLAGTPVVWDPACLLHAPAEEVWLGVATPGTELPERAVRILAAVTAAGAVPVPPGDAPPPHDLLRQVHHPGLLAHLQGGHEQWLRAGFAQAPGQSQVVPYVFPTAGMLAGLPVREAAAVQARAGRWCYDTMTLIGAGTWQAALAAAHAARAAAELVAAGAPLAYALVRPPGHHATRDAFGGSCYLNNAAVAVQALLAAGAGRVAVVDVDAHHGNGTQAIYYDRPDVAYGSLHVDPAAGWFPHYAGFADEAGTGAGLGRTMNVPLPPGAGDRAWLDAVERLSAWVQGFGPDALVVSLGVDAAAADPESPLKVSPEGYRRTGRTLAGLAPRVVVVQEGGYHLPTVGPLVVAALAGLARR